MKSVIKRKKKLIILIILALLVIYTLWSNLTVGTTYYKVSSDKLPDAFDNFKIAHVSDLHNAEYGKNNARLQRILESEKPDIIVITGDLVDSKRTDIDMAVDFVKKAMEIAPCFYVTGNHESRLGRKYEHLESRLVELGVNVMRDKRLIIYKDNESIQIAGLDDPGFTYGGSFNMGRTLDRLNLSDGYTILLTHRPEMFDVYVASGVDLVLSGHSHGGQVRLPFIGGMVAPNQGLFPKYDGGKYSERDTTMIVSRGIGNSLIPIRINNRPEVVIVKLISTR